MTEMRFPAEDGKPQRVRRTVLGPVRHMAQTPPDATEGHPPFCTCCLLINSFEADAFYGLRLFAPHGGDGNPGTTAASIPGR